MVKFLQQITLLSSPIHTTRLQPIVKTLPSSHGNKQQFLEQSSIPWPSICADLMLTIPREQQYIPSTFF